MEKVTAQKVRDVETANTERSSRVLAKFFDPFDKALNALMSSIDLANNTILLGRDEGFMYAYVGLGSKVVSNVFSAMSLLKAGHYGDCLVLTRVAMSGVNTIQFLAAHDEHVNDWRLYSLPDTSPTERRRIYRVFAEKNIRQGLEAKGLDPQSNTFQVLSESVHSSLHGLQVYAEETYGCPNTHRFQLLPSYDALRAGGTAVPLLGLIIVAVDTFYNRFLDAIGETEEWRTFAEGWLPVRSTSLDACERLKTFVEEELAKLRMATNSAPP